VIDTSTPPGICPYCAARTEPIQLVTGAGEHAIGYGPAGAPRAWSVSRGFALPVAGVLRGEACQSCRRVTLYAEAAKEVSPAPDPKGHGDEPTPAA
jgi:hypothetical protein